MSAWAVIFFVGLFEGTVAAWGGASLTAVDIIFAAPLCVAAGVRLAIGLSHGEPQ